MNPAETTENDVHPAAGDRGAAATAPARESAATFAEIVAGAVVAESVSHVFGLMGARTIELSHHLTNADATMHASRHESGAAVAVLPVEVPSRAMRATRSSCSPTAPARSWPRDGASSLPSSRCRGVRGRDRTAGWHDGALGRGRGTLVTGLLAA